jgi:hypothetical protein
MNFYSLLETTITFFALSNFKFKRCNSLYRTFPTKASPLTLFYTNYLSLDYLQTSLSRTSPCTSVLLAFLSILFSLLTLHFLWCYIFLLPQFFFFLSTMFSIHVHIFLFFPSLTICHSSHVYTDVQHSNKASTSPEFIVFPLLGVVQITEGQHFQ